jgi:hypothetical protein
MAKSGLEQRSPPAPSVLHINWCHWHLMTQLLSYSEAPFHNTVCATGMSASLSSLLVWYKKCTANIVQWVVDYDINDVFLQYSYFCTDYCTLGTYLHCTCTDNYYQVLYKDRKDTRVHVELVPRDYKDRKDTVRVWVRAQKDTVLNSVWMWLEWVSAPTSAASVMRVLPVAILSE